MIKYENVPDQFAGLYDAVDKSNPFVQQITGLYKRPAMDGGECWFYTPEGTLQSAKAVLILIDEETCPACFMKNSGWYEAATEGRFIVVIAKPQSLGLEKWLPAQTGASNEASAEVAKLTKFIADCVRVKTYFNVRKSCVSIVGYGAGAAAAARVAAYTPQGFSAVVLFGGQTTEEIYADAGEKTTAVDYIKADQIAMPVWVIGEQANANPAVAYYTESNQCEEVPYAKGDTLYYMPDQCRGESQIHEQFVAQVRVTEAEAENFYEMTQDVADFVTSYIREPGVDHDDLHLFKSPEEWGFERHTLDIDGYNRYWWEFVPDYSLRHPEEKLPLVLNLHGGSNNADMDTNAGEWVKVARERNFFLVSPTGTLRRFTDKVPHPAWNAADAPDIMDDIKFIRELIADAEKRLPVDETRVYVTGHSMGSAMTQHVLLSLPDIFAAGASNGGVVRGGYLGTFDFPGVRTDRKVPVWIQMGENDVGGGTYEVNASAKKTVEYWIDRNETQPIDEAYEYHTGPYRHKVYTTKNNIPMIEFITTDNKPHCVTPQDPWFYYDEFFAKFSRDAEGNVYYMGRKVY